MICSSFPPQDTRFDLGSAPLLAATYTDDVGVPADPTSVVVKVRRPDGTTVTYTNASLPAVTHPSLGNFELSLPATTQAGDWWYRFEATGAVADAKETRFTILGSAFTTVAPPAAGRWISAESLRDEPELTDVKLPSGVTLDDIVVASTDLLDLWVGPGRYGSRSETIRPNRSSSRCGGDSCDAWTYEQRLAGPTLPGSIVVVVDGVTLSSTAYLLVDGDTLVRVDGRPWPCCQRIEAPFGSPGTWSISYTWGKAPKKIGEIACRALAINIALRLSGKPSKLPPGTVSVAARGLSLNLARQHDRTGRRQGKQNVFTGIAVVDDFVFAENPNGLSRRATVTSPDSVRRTRI